MIAVRTIDNSCMLWKRLNGLLWNVSLWTFMFSVNCLLQYAIQSKKLILLNIARRLLAWTMEIFYTWNLKLGLAFTFLLESDTTQFTERFAKIWQTFLWTLGNFMLQLNRKRGTFHYSVRFPSGQLTRLYPHVVIIISCLKMRDKINWSHTPTNKRFPRKKSFTNYTPEKWDSQHHVTYIWAMDLPRVSL
jgi:hypothetical protein